MPSDLIISALPLSDLYVSVAANNARSGAVAPEPEVEVAVRVTPPASSGEGGMRRRAAVRVVALEFHDADGNVTYSIPALV